MRVRTGHGLGHRPPGAGGQPRRAYAGRTSTASSPPWTRPGVDWFRIPARVPAAHRCGRTRDRPGPGPRAAGGARPRRRPACWRSCGRRGRKAAGPAHRRRSLRVCWPVTDPHGSLVLGPEYGLRDRVLARARRHPGRAAQQPDRRRDRRRRAGGQRARAGVRRVQRAGRHHRATAPGRSSRCPARTGSASRSTWSTPGSTAATRPGRPARPRRWATTPGWPRPARWPPTTPGTRPATSCATRCARCTASRPGSGTIFLVTDDQVPAWLDTDAARADRGQPPGDLRRHRAAADVQLAGHRVAAAPHPGAERALPLPQRRRVPGPAGDARTCSSRRAG